MPLFFLAKNIDGDSFGRTTTWLDLQPIMPAHLTWETFRVKANEEPGSQKTTCLEYLTKTARDPTRWHGHNSLEIEIGKEPGMFQVSFTLIYWAIVASNILLGLNEKMIL